MNYKQPLLSLFLTGTALSFTSNLPACTGVLLTAQDGSAINGRTVEFGMDLDMSVAIIPRNMEFTGTTPSGPGLTYTSKYGSAGVYCFREQALMDGINEKGLTAAAFYFPGYASYTPLSSENQKQALSSTEFVNWVLSNFATIEEVKEGVSGITIVPTVYKQWGNAPPPMHYIVYDKSGRSIVIEPLEGTLKVFDNPVGTITNSPSFDWHLQNLNNYIHLSPVNATSKKIRDLQLTPFGQGSGMQGLPGDFTPPSRFVRATLFSATAVPSKTGDETVEQTFHVLNQFDIPLGSVCQKDKGALHYDYTMLTTVKDPQSGKYYYKSYKDQTIRFVDLKQFDLDAKEIKSLRITGQHENVDSSSLLK